MRPKNQDPASPSPLATYSLELRMSCGAHAGGARWPLSLGSRWQGAPQQQALPDDVPVIRACIPSDVYHPSASSAHQLVEHPACIYEWRRALRGQQAQSVGVALPHERRRGHGCQRRHVVGRNLHSAKRGVEEDEEHQVCGKVAQGVAEGGRRLVRRAQPEDGLLALHRVDPPAQRRAGSTALATQSR